MTNHRSLFHYNVGYSQSFVSFLCIVLFLMTSEHDAHAQSVGIGTTTPHSSAILELKDTNKGFLMPRMTTAQRDAIVNPAEGLMIYNLDAKCMETYHDNAWNKNCNLVADHVEVLPADSWNNGPKFPGTPRTGAVAFSIGSKGYIGTGASTDGYKNDFWEYNSVSKSWTQKANVGGLGRNDAIAISIGDKGYIGSGISAQGLLNDFWEYSPITNTWLQKSNFGGLGRQRAAGFAIANKGYIGTGIQNGISKKDFWQYNPLTNSWTQMADFGGPPRSDAVGFTIDGKGYMGFGFGINDFWEFDPSNGVNGTWTQKSNVSSNNNFKVGISIGNKGYICFGGPSANQLWEFDPNNGASGTWIQKTNFPKTPLDATGFSIGNRGYICPNLFFQDGNLSNELWIYNPLIDTVGTVYTANLHQDATSIKDHDWTLEGNTLATSGENIDVEINGQFVDDIKFNKSIIFSKTPTTKINFKNSNIEKYRFSISSTNLKYEVPPINTEGHAFYAGADRILSFGKINNSPENSVQFANTLKNKKIALWDGSDEHQFFGIGIESGTMRFHVSSIGIVFSFNRGVSPTTSAEIMTISGAGNLSIAYQAYKPGGGTWQGTSDLRVKKNILPYSNGLKEILQIKPKSYQYNGRGNTPDNNKTYIGVLAQEIEQVLPSTVTKSKVGDISDLRSFNSSELTYTLINAVKELNAKNAALTKQNEEIETLLILLEAKIK